MYKFIITFIIFIHGIIHLLGFVKAFQFGQVAQLTKHISKPIGVFWLIACLLFILLSYLYFNTSTYWWAIAFIGIFISQILIIAFWQDAKFGTIANLIILLISIPAFSSWLFYQSYLKDLNIQKNQPGYFDSNVLSESDIVHLPELIKKYLHYTKVVGKPKVNYFYVAFKGQIRKNDQSDWMPFNSEQNNFLSFPTRLFYMKAVMKNLPVDGYHHYIQGKACMDIRLLSLVKVQYMEGAIMDKAETVTFFNDMCLMAPSTLIDPRIKWLETIDQKIKASFTFNDVTIFAWLYFNNDGALINFSSNDRYNADLGKNLEWFTPVKAYSEINGYHLATKADLSYRYPEGDQVYGQFEMTGLEYNQTKIGY